ncbi:alpha/beta fold hydrolase [Nubsella zeaxanthinifaciens]|uniref:alpha/beta fold hydrolase n=1 Tax=Nubsella zeaxanthinifaciens TaxID=392412 RepID=UPI003D0362CB
MPVFQVDSSCSLSYHEYGSGTALLLAFHGFGMKGTQFKVLEASLGKKYKIISFDLFFHGETTLQDCDVKKVRKGLQPVFFTKQIKQFLGALYPETEKVSLLSYSIGTRMALALIEQMPERIASAYLIAPDGIEPNKLLKLGGANFLVNRLFYRLVYSPKTVYFLLNLLLKLNYVDAAIYRILQAEFGTVDTRLTCYNTITYYGTLSFDRRRIANQINENNIEVHLYFGKKDKLFPSQIGERFAKLLHLPNIHLFDDGHELVKEKMNQYLTAQLQQSNDYQRSSN